MNSVGRAITGESVEAGPVAHVSPGPLSFGERVAAAKAACDVFEDARRTLACAAAYHSDQVEFLAECRAKYIEAYEAWGVLVKAMGRPE